MLLNPGPAPADKFNYYAAPADLYVPQVAGRRGSVSFRRFPTAAKALLYAMETLDRHRRDNTILEVEGERHDASQMRRLYEAAEFPLARLGD